MEPSSLAAALPARPATVPFTTAPASRQHRYPCCFWRRVLGAGKRLVTRRHKVSLSTSRGLGQRPSNSTFTACQFTQRLRHHQRHVRRAQKQRDLSRDAEGEAEQPNLPSQAKDAALAGAPPFRLRQPVDPVESNAARDINRGASALVSCRQATSNLSGLTSARAIVCA